ncbi:hypothetical protein NF27_IB00030 [Candidatus Jidaibacter acanthamoeba]|uniref:NACHT domain-containing protein n=1 Tax=Candidatus Jidaibacter acanthamoebae TaxID=86105 RepID=A0A0C1MWW8_9RICK|nr:ankyrin repeat domain-containing protein [Candidatus Jidaibacter acanthamoeba]KIE04396.1 hypothetical protein NF27_IB00030 [Candidatus Jidaibacter acanthamoeba]
MLERNHEIIISKLKQYYQNFRYLNNLVRKNQLVTESFINLAILKKQTVDEKERLLREIQLKEADYGRIAKIRDERIETYESVHEDKVAIDIESLFDKRASKEIKKLAIYGRAGVGKSTLCQYIAVRWSEEKIWNGKYKAIIWLPLREVVSELEGQKEKLLLASIIRKHCIAGRERNKPSIEDIDDFLGDFSNVLFLLDGYDEIAPIIDRENKLKQLLKEILIDQNSNLIITSRTTSKITQVGNIPINIDEELENIGFDSNNIISYINKFMPLGKKEAMLNFLKNNKNIWGIAHTPINLELICYAWEDLRREESYTMSKLYKVISGKLLRRYLAKNSGKEFMGEEAEEVGLNEWEECRELVLKLEELAIEGMKRNEVVISKEVVARVLGRETKEVLKTGIIKNIGEEIIFLHLTFQEYFAARYIARSIKEIGSPRFKEAVDLIMKHKYTPYYEVMWWYVAGVLYDRCKLSRDYVPLIWFWHLIETEPRELIGIRHVCLQVRCLDECEVDTKINIHNKLLTNIENLVTNNWYDNFLIEKLRLSPNILKNILHIYTSKLDDEEVSAAQAIINFGNVESKLLVRAILVCTGSYEVQSILEESSEALTIIAANEKNIIFNLINTLKEIILDNTSEVRLKNITNLIILLGKKNVEIKDYIKSVLVELLNSNEKSIQSIAIVILSEFSQIQDEKLKILLSNPNKVQLSKEILNYLLHCISEEEKSFAALCRTYEIVLNKDDKRTTNIESVFPYKFIKLKYNEIKYIIEKLEESLLSNNEDSKCAVIETIDQLKQLQQDTFKKGLSYLQRLLFNKNHITRIQAAYALLDLEETPVETSKYSVQVLIKILSNKVNIMFTSIIDILHMRALKNDNMLNFIQQELYKTILILFNSEQHAMGVKIGETLRQIGTDEYVNKLADLLNWLLNGANDIEKEKYIDLETKMRAIDVLCRCKQVPTASLTSTIQFFKIFFKFCSETDLISSAIFTMENICITRPEFRSELVEILTTALKNKDIRCLAAHSLVKLNEVNSQNFFLILQEVIEGINYEWEINTESIEKLLSTEWRLLALNALSLLNNELIESASFSLLTILECFKISKNIQWLQDFLVNTLEQKAYLFVQEDKLFLYSNNTKKQITFNKQLISIVLEELKKQAIEFGLPIEVYNHYLGQDSLGFKDKLLKEQTVLHKAAEIEDLKTIEAILAQSKIDINDQNNEFKITPLILAAQTLHWRAVKLLVEKGADINRYYLPKKGAPRNVIDELLYIYKLHLNDIDYYEGVYTLLKRQQTTEGNQDNIQCIDEETSKILIKAIQEGNSNNLKKLLEGLNLNYYIDSENNTLLLYAIRHKSNIEVIKLLLRKGASVTQNNSQRENAISTCKKSIDILKGRIIEEEFIGIIGYLIEKRKPVDKLHLDNLLSRFFKYSNQSEQLIYNTINELLGRNNIQGIIENNSNKYAQYLINAVNLKIEHGKEFIPESSDKLEMLSIRIFIYFNYLAKLIIFNEGNKEKIKNISSEILNILETYNNKRIVALYDQRVPNTNDRVFNFLKGYQAQNIYNQVKLLEVGQEYSCASGYTNLEQTGGHAIYVSFVKIDEEQVIIRIDNRWLRGSGLDQKLHGKAPWVINDNPPRIKPYLLVISSLNDNLKIYIENILLANSNRAISVQHAIKLIYSFPNNSNISKDEQETYSKDWPYQVKQEESYNCVLSSHNFGVMIRRGRELYNELHREEKSYAYGKSEFNVIIEPQDIQKQISLLTTHVERLSIQKPKSKELDKLENELKNNSTTLSKESKEVLKKLLSEISDLSNKEKSSIIYSTIKKQMLGDKGQDIHNISIQITSKTKGVINKFVKACFDSKLLNSNFEPPYDKSATFVIKGEELLRYSQNIEINFDTPVEKV